MKKTIRALLLFMATGLILCSLALLLQAALRKAASESAPTLSLRDRRIQRMLIAAVLIVAFFLLWETVGFLILAPITLFPQTLINVRLQGEQDWRDNARLQDDIRAVEAELGNTGRVLIRASGTEPVLRVMVEAQDGRMAQQCASRLASVAGG